jgi:chemotaxis protein MotB
MRHRRPLLSTDEGTKDIWPSFTDVMTTMALILFVLVLMAYVKNLMSTKRLDGLQRQIASSAQRLRVLEGDLRRTSAEIEAGKSQLDASEQKLKEQESVIGERNRELGGLRTRLQGIAVLRVEVLNKVKQSIETELRPALAKGGELVAIGENGNIVINESLVFEFNSFAIKKDGQPLLDTLARALGKVLADPEVREHIDAVVIQGHTDERGSSAFNRDLSAKRANAVLGYLFEVNKTLEQSYGSYFAASAYSKFRPINAATTEQAYAQNRRIEISLVLKDANVRKVIDDYMRSADPAAPAPAPVP